MTWTDEETDSHFKEKKLIEENYTMSDVPSVSCVHGLKIAVVVTSAILLIYLTFQDLSVITWQMTSQGGTMTSPGTLKVSEKKRCPSALEYLKCFEGNETKNLTKHCLNLRKLINTENPTWTPWDRCNRRQFISKQGCELLDGGSVYFIGDSLLRHLYTGFLIALRRDFKDNTIRGNETASAKWQSMCSGMNIFKDERCRYLLDPSPVNICGGRVNISWTKLEPSRMWSDLTSHSKEKIGHRRSLFVVGIPGGYSTVEAQLNFITPPFEKIRRQDLHWPKIIFLDTTAWVITKNPDNQNEKDIMDFNGDAKISVKHYDNSVLETVERTERAQGYDITRTALNNVYAQIILSYIQELSDSGRW